MVVIAPKNWNNGVEIIQWQRSKIKRKTTELTGTSSGDGVSNQSSNSGNLSYSNNHGNHAAIVDANNPGDRLTVNANNSLVTKANGVPQKDQLPSSVEKLLEVVSSWQQQYSQYGVNTGCYGRGGNTSAYGVRGQLSALFLSLLPPGGV